MVRLFTDEKLAYIIRPDINAIITILNNQLVSISEWWKDYKLILTLNKTKYVYGFYKKERESSKRQNK